MIITVEAKENIFTGDMVALDAAHNTVTLIRTLRAIRRFQTEKSVKLSVMPNKMVIVAGMEREFKSSIKKLMGNY